MARREEFIEPLMRSQDECGSRQTATIEVPWSMEEECGVCVQVWVDPGCCGDGKDETVDRGLTTRCVVDQRLMSCSCRQESREKGGETGMAGRCGELLEGDDEVLGRQGSVVHARDMVRERIDPWSVEMMEGDYLT